jgi:hypothetical protein
VKQLSWSLIQAQKDYKIEKVSSTAHILRDEVVDIGCGQETQWMGTMTGFHVPLFKLI